MARKHKGEISKVAASLAPVLRDIGKGQRGVHPEIWARWAEIVGSDLSHRAVPVRLERGRLVVAVASSAWMSELSYLKTALIDRFAEAVGPDVVKEIRFVVDHSIARRG